MKKFFCFLVFLSGVWCLVSGVSFAVDYLQETNPGELESSAKYNYYIGQYYYTQGRFNDAETYFERSRDMIERKNDIIAGKANLIPTQAVGGGGGLEYTLGEGDVLFISVWQNEDLNQEVIVRPDGRISFPLVGDIVAAGRTIMQLDADITARLKEFIKMPEVSISIRKLGGSKVIILGEVMRPGVYAVSGNRTILEALALAGGFTRDAVGNSVVLVRGGLQNPQARRLNLKKVLVGTNFDGNIPLESDDIIYVPRTFISDVGYVLTQVIDPVSRGTFAADVMRKWQPH
jgi:polysaccharide export outer membrane protein